MAQAPSEEEQQVLRSIVPLIQSHALTEAEARLTIGLERFPQSAILENALGIVYRQENKPQAAMDAFEKALRILPSFTAAQLHLGSLYIEVQKCSRAVPLLVAAGESTSDVGALEAAGLGLSQCDEYRRASLVLTKAHAMDPRSASLTYNLALALYKDGQSKESLQVLQSLAESDRQTPDVLSLEGMLRTDAGLELIRAERYSEAVELLESALLKAEAPAGSWSALGLAQFRLGRYNAAIQSYSRAIKSDPKLDAAREGLAFLLYITGDLEQSRKIVEQGLQNFDADFYLSELRALILYRTSRDLWPEALRSVNRALKQNSGFAPGFFLRGKMEMEQGDSAAALQDFQAAVNLDPKFALPYYKMTQLYLRQGRTAEAEAARKHFVELGSLREEEVLTRQAQDMLLRAAGPK
jgi:tetratricopeptide (TPR) repeat protein